MVVWWCGAGVTVASLIVGCLVVVVVGEVLMVLVVLAMVVG